MRTVIIASLLMISISASINCNFTSAMYGIQNVWWGDASPAGKFELSYVGSGWVQNTYNSTSERFEFSTYPGYTTCSSSNNDYDCWNYGNVDQLTGYCDQGVIILNNAKGEIDEITQQITWVTNEWNGPTKWSLTPQARVSQTHDASYVNYYDNSPYGKPWAKYQGSAEVYSTLTKDFLQSDIEVIATWDSCQSQNETAYTCSLIDNNKFEGYKNDNEFIMKVEVDSRLETDIYTGESKWTYLSWNGPQQLTVYPITETVSETFKAVYSFHLDLGAVGGKPIVEYEGTAKIYSNRGDDQTDVKVIADWSSCTSGDETYVCDFDRYKEFEGYRNEYVFIVNNCKGETTYPAWIWTYNAWSGPETLAITTLSSSEVY